MLSRFGAASGATKFLATAMPKYRSRIDLWQACEARNRQLIHKHQLIGHKEDLRVFGPRIE